MIYWNCQTIRRNFSRHGIIVGFESVRCDCVTAEPLVDIIDLNEYHTTLIATKL